MSVTGWLQGLWDGLRETFSLLKGWSGPLLSVFAVATSFLTWPVTMMSWAVSKVVTGLASLLLPSGFVTSWNSAVDVVGNTLSFANSFLPVTETLTMGAALFGLWAACATYRLVKSWIPTVS